VKEHLNPCEQDFMMGGSNAWLETYINYLHLAKKGFTFYIGNHGQAPTLIITIPSKQLLFMYPGSQHSTLYTLLLTIYWSCFMKSFSLLQLKQRFTSREGSICKSSNFVSISGDIAIGKFCLVITFLLFTCFLCLLGLEDSGYCLLWLHYNQPYITYNFT
jgi:hypothetical protein